MDRHISFCIDKYQANIEASFFPLVPSFCQRPYFASSDLTLLCLQSVRLYYIDSFLALAHRQALLNILQFYFNSLQSSNFLQLLMKVD